MTSDTQRSKYVLVPREPTEAMMRAAIDAIPMDKYIDVGAVRRNVTLSTDECATIYRAMLEATPPKVGSEELDAAGHELVMRAVDLACNHLIFYDQHFDVVTRQKFYDVRDDMRQWLVDQADAALAVPVEVVGVKKEPFAFCCSSFDIDACDCVNKYHGQAIRGGALQPPDSPALEAVAWQRFNGTTERWIDTPSDEIDRYRRLGVAVRPLFTGSSPALEAGVAEVTPGDYVIIERVDDMFIAQRHWQLGNICIACRPNALSNDQWRPTAQRIVAALSITEDGK